MSDEPLVDSPISKGDISSWRTHLKSVIGPTVYYFERLKKNKVSVATTEQQKMVEINTAVFSEILESGLSGVEKAQRPSLLLRRYHSIFSSSAYATLGSDGGASMRNDLVRMIIALEDGYKIHNKDEIEKEKNKLDMAIKRVRRELPESEKFKLDALSTYAVSVIERDSHRARFVVREWLEQNYSAVDRNENEANEARIAEKLVNEISLAIDRNEVIIEGIDELHGKAQASGRNIIVVVREAITDTHLLRAFAEDYNVRGFISCRGSSTDHTALIAGENGAFVLVDLPEYAYDILPDNPGIMPVTGWIAATSGGEEADFYAGPTNTVTGKEMMDRYIDSVVMEKYFREQEKERHKTTTLTITTRDDKFPGEDPRVIMTVAANISVEDDVKKSVHIIEHAYEEGAYGVGLGRTEYMYASKSPSQKDQVEIYRSIAQVKSPVGMKPPVTLRTFDREFKKPCKGLDENNARYPNSEKEFGFDYYRTVPGREALKVQVKAMFIAFAQGARNLRIMFPMVSTVEDIDFLGDVLDEAKAEVCSIRFFLPWNAIRRDVLDEMQIGIMIENKKVVDDLEQVLIYAKERIGLRFASIGTNDLTSDYKNIPRDTSDPSGGIKDEHFDKEIMDVVKKIAEVTSGLGIYVGICGDAARLNKTRMFTMHLYEHTGMHGVPMTPSVAPDLIPRIKGHISAMSFKESTDALRNWKTLSDEQINRVIAQHEGKLIDRIKKSPEYEAVYAAEMGEIGSTHAFKPLHALKAAAVTALSTVALAGVSLRYGIVPELIPLTIVFGGLVSIWYMAWAFSAAKAAGGYIRGLSVIMGYSDIDYAGFERSVDTMLQMSSFKSYTRDEMIDFLTLTLMTRYDKERRLTLEGARGFVNLYYTDRIEGEHSPFRVLKRWSERIMTHERTPSEIYGMLTPVPVFGMLIRNLITTIIAPAVAIAATIMFYGSVGVLPLIAAGVLAVWFKVQVDSEELFVARLAAKTEGLVGMAMSATGLKTLKRRAFAREGIEKMRLEDIPSEEHVGILIGIVAEPPSLRGAEGVPSSLRESEATEAISNMVKKINAGIGGVKVVVLGGKDDQANLDMMVEYSRKYNVYASRIIDLRGEESGLELEKDMGNLVFDVIEQIEKEDSLRFLASPANVSLENTASGNENIIKIKELENVLDQLFKEYHIPVIKSLRLAELSMFEYKFASVARDRRVLNEDTSLSAKLEQIAFTMDHTNRMKVASFSADSIVELKWLADEYRKAIEGYDAGRSTDSPNFPIKLHVRLSDEQVNKMLDAIPKNERTAKLAELLETAGISKDLISADDITVGEAKSVEEIQNFVRGAYADRGKYGVIENENIIVCDNIRTDNKLTYNKEKDKSQLVRLETGVSSQALPVVIALIANGNDLERTKASIRNAVLNVVNGIIFIRPIMPINVNELSAEIRRYEKILIAA